MTNTTAQDLATIAESPELVDVLNMAAHALRLEIEDGIVDANAPKEMKLALVEQAFLTIGLDRILYHPDYAVRESIVQGIGRLVYRDGLAA